ncbi:MAG: transcription termination/antitermination protein NusG [Candidatus Makana argininalis]
MDFKKKWYIVQVITGKEKIIIDSIKEYININNMKKLFGEIILPMERVLEIKKGQHKKTEFKLLPGYILINMIMNNKSWHLIKRVPKIINFIGGTSFNPTYLSEKEVSKIKFSLKNFNNKPRPKTIFEPGELIRVKDGPFSDFNGIVEEIDYEKNRLKLSISIFSRSTPVDLDFDQVEKI